MRSKLTLERELCNLLGTGRNARIAARYYGCDGRGGGSLQAVGNEIGLTRERVRQIVTAASESLSTRRAVSPALDRTIAFVADHMPAAAGAIEAELRSQRLTSGLFRLEGVIKVAELLGRRLPAYDRPQMRWFDRASVKPAVLYLAIAMLPSRFGALSRGSHRFRRQRSGEFHRRVHQIRSNGQRYGPFFPFPRDRAALSRELAWSAS